MLKRLRAQAGVRALASSGAPPTTPSTTAAIPNVADPALRRLLLDTLARRRPPPPSLSPQAKRSDTTPSLSPQAKGRAGEGCSFPLATRPFPPDRTLPGTELAPGLHLREHWPGLRATDVDARGPADGVLPLPILGTRNITEPAARERLLFFDTETTGLAGGTGTRAFMVGAADWPAGRLRVRQLWITQLSAEAAMLDAFRGWLAPDTVLVSYNGKSYDAPLLATRYRLARRRNPLDGLPHLDLLHPVRRRYRGTWENCRLATIERQLLRILRDDDLPGSEAPAAFLGYLRGGSAHPLRRVLAHNHQDVVTLAVLLERLLAP